MFLRFSLPSLAISHGADSVGKWNLKERSERDDRQPTTERFDDLYGNWEAKKTPGNFRFIFIPSDLLKFHFSIGLFAGL